MLDEQDEIEETRFDRTEMIKVADYLNFIKDELADDGIPVRVGRE